MDALRSTYRKCFLVVKCCYLIMETAFIEICTEQQFITCSFKALESWLEESAPFHSWGNSTDKG